MPAFADKADLIRIQVECSGLTEADITPTLELFAASQHLFWGLLIGQADLQMRRLFVRPVGGA
jgi:hypothetical protein